MFICEHDIGQTFAFVDILLKPDTLLASIQIHFDRHSHITLNVLKAIQVCMLGVWFIFI